MTEPGTGSDLQGITTTAKRTAEVMDLNGAKTFITNGIHADLVVVVARTDQQAGSRGFSLLVVERGMAGFERGRRLKKVGLKAQDTAELSFTDVHVPAANLLGNEGQGFIYLMQNLAQERLSIGRRRHRLGVTGAWSSRWPTPRTAWRSARRSRASIDPVRAC